MTIRTLLVSLLMTPILCFSQDVVQVTNLLDDGPGSFRHAIATAFDSDTVRVQVTGTITLTSGSISYDKTLVIEGSGMDALFISGSDVVTPLVVTGGSTYISGLTLRDGFEGSGTPGVAGGMAFNGDTLYMREVRISECRLTGIGGNMRTGGGLRAIAQKVRIYDSAFTLNNILPEPNDNGSAWGGGAYIVSDDVLLRSTTFSDNIARGRQNQGAGGSYGGGLFINGEGRVENCIIENNIARTHTYYGGGPDVDAFAYGGGLYLEYGSDITVSGGSISGNTTEVIADGDPYQFGAGVYGRGVLLTVEDCTLNNNSMPTNNPAHVPAEGGAIHMDDGRLTVRNCTLDGNSASKGSGISWHQGNNFFGQHQVLVERTRVLNGNGDQASGAIRVYYADALRMTEVEVSGNERRGLLVSFTDTMRVDRCLFDSNGGGAYIEHQPTSQNLFLNSTFHDNVADIGAALRVEYSSCSVVNCTMMNDTLDGSLVTSAGREIKVGYGSVLLRNTILSSVAFQPTGAYIGDNAAAASAGGNVVRDNSAASFLTDPTDLNNINPQLDSFGYHGGFTRTWSLAVNSTSIDQGGADTLGVDQRGFLRDGSADAGAFEYGGIDTQQIFLAGTSEDANLCVGEALSVSVQASSSAPINYQWQLDGTDISGANESSYSTTANLVDEGSYTCVLTTAGDTIIAGPILIEVEICTGVADQAVNELRAWPVPARDQLWLDGIGAHVETLVVRDALGRVIHTQRVMIGRIHQFDVSGWSSGIYAIELWGGKERAALRFVKE